MATPLARAALPGAQPLARSAAIRSWFLLERSPLPLEVFRIAAGSALCAHFALHFAQTVELLAFAGVYDATIAGLPVEPGWLGSGLAPWTLRCVFGAGMLCAAAVALGIAARVAAGLLYALCVLTYAAIFPVAGLDDQLANLSALFLVLLPVGTRLCLSASRPRRTRAERATVPGLSAALLLVQLSVVYLGTRPAELLGEGAAGSRAAELALRAIPLAFVLPVPYLSAVGLLLQLGVHGYGLAHGQAVLANLVLLASGVLFWGERETRAPRRLRFDAGAVVAAACIALSAVFVLAPELGVPARSEAATRILADAGLLPPPGQPSSEPGRLVVSIRDPDGREHRRRLHPAGGAHTRRWLGRLAGGEAERVLSASFAAAAARRHCRGRGYLGQTGRLIWAAAGRERELAQFECGPAGALARFR